jgi:hypothetical protein
MIYLLGGKDHHAADREAAEQALKFWPEMAFTTRAKFLDIGADIPTAGNLHQVAQAIAPACRLVYVGYDPVVLALLVSHEAGATNYVDADLRDTGKILAEASQLLDFTRPVAITLMAILNAIPDDDDPHAIVARLLDAVPAASSPDDAGEDYRSRLVRGPFT